MKGQTVEPPAVPTKRSLFDRIAGALKELAEARKHKTVAVGVVSAVIAGLLKAQALTATFPEPWNTWANAALFVAIMLIAVDFMLGGLSR